MDFLKKHAKTLGAFVAGFIGNKLLDLINGTTSFPTTKEEWLRYAVTSLGADIGAYGLRNKVTEKQIEKGVTKGDITPEAAVTAAVNAPPPKPTPPPVPPVSGDGGSIVDQLIRDAQWRSG